MNLLPGFTTHLLRLTKSLSAFAYLIAKTARLAMPSARSSLTLLLPSIVGAFACQNFTLGHAMRKIIPHSMLPSIVGAFTYYLLAVAGTWPTPRCVYLALSMYLCCARLVAPPVLQAQRARHFRLRGAG